MSDNTKTALTTDEVLAAAVARIAELEAKLRTKRSTRPTQACECGCGGQTQGRFMPGHDAKLKSRLQADYRQTKDETRRQAAWEKAVELGWEKFLPAPLSNKDRRSAMKAELDQLKAAIEATKAKLAAERNEK